MILSGPSIIPSERDVRDHKVCDHCIEKSDDAAEVDL